MSVYLTLNLVDCTDKAAWKALSENQRAVNGVAAKAIVEQKLVDSLVSAGGSALSQQLRDIRAAERSVPDAVLQMNFR